jgi:(S)-sulfolactate dehydrogenase
LSISERKLPDIVISEFMDKDIAFEVLGNLDMQYNPTLVDDRIALLENLAEARAIIVRNRTQVNNELLEHAPNLQVVGRLGVGLDNIDLEACKSRNVVVCPATGANDVAVAEYTITAALVLLRGAWNAIDRMIAGEWPRTDLMGREISGKRLGLIGFGSIAREVAARASALGLDIFGGTRSCLVKRSPRDIGRPRRRLRRHQCPRAINRRNASSDRRRVHPQHARRVHTHQHRTRWYRR